MLSLFCILDHAQTELEMAFSVDRERDGAAIGETSMSRRWFENFWAVHRPSHSPLYLAADIVSASSVHHQCARPCCPMSAQRIMSERARCPPARPPARPPAPLMPGSRLG